jgi:putative ABC transport system substrate-binding protein
MLRHTAVKAAHFGRSPSGPVSICLCLGLLISACTVLPGSAQKRIPHIGVIVDGPPDSPQQECLDALVAGLRDLGYVDGQTIFIDSRFQTDSGNAQLSALAKDLVAQHVDVIVACATPASIAAQQATTGIPILALDVGDPVRSGLLPSLARPGGNVTAISNSVRSVPAKLVEFLREVVPGLTRTAVLVDPTNPANVDGANSFRAAAEATGVHVEIVELSSADDLQAAFETSGMAQAQAVYVQANPVSSGLKQLADLLIKHRLPAISLNHTTVQNGGILMSYGPDHYELERQGATYVDRMLKGANPADLPVQAPTAYELWINAKTAQALGIAIPPDLADQVTNWIQ